MATKKLSNCLIYLLIAELLTIATAAALATTCCK
jgi:hypothetical protein